MNINLILDFIYKYIYNNNFYKEDIEMENKNFNVQNTLLIYFEKRSEPKIEERKLMERRNGIKRYLSILTESHSYVRYQIYPEGWRRACYDAS